MKKIIFTLFLLYLTPSLIAQTYILPQIAYNQFLLKGNNWIDKWYTFRGDYWEEGHTLGVAIRHHLPHFYLQSGLYYANDVIGTTILNTKIAYSPIFGNETTIIGNSRSFIRLSTPLILGIKIASYKKINIRLMAGLMGSYRFKKDINENWQPDTTRPNYSYLEARQTIVRERLGNIYVPFSLDATIGVGIDIGKFTIDVRRTEGLTNLAKDVEFEGNSYPFSWKSKQISITLGWKFRIDKNRPCKVEK